VPQEGVSGLRSRTGDADVLEHVGEQHAGLEHREVPAR